MQLRLCLLFAFIVAIAAAAANTAMPTAVDYNKRLGRDLGEFVASANQAYRGLHADNSSQLFSHMRTLVEQAEALLLGNDDDELDTNEDSSDDSNASPATDPYSAFETIFDTSVQYVQQPQQVVRGIKQVADALVLEHAVRRSQRPNNVLSVRHDIVMVPENNMWVARITEVQSLSNGGQRRLLDVYFVFAHRRATDQQGVPGEWAIKTIEHLPTVENPLQLSAELLSL